MENVTDLLIQSKNGDKEVRNTLIENNLGLVHHIVKRYLGRGYDAEDLFQIGVIGLIKAVDNFDTTRNYCFSTYAVPLILGEIKRFFRDDGMVKISRRIKENAYRIKQENEGMIKRSGREATISELMDLTGLEQEEIVLALESTKEVESIYKTIYRSDGSQVYLLDKLADVIDENEQISNRIVLQELLESMEETEQQLIRLRYFENKTQTQVAEIMGISQVQVSRQEKKVLLKMRKLLG